MLMKANFLNLVAKMPQNTGGGNSQSFTLQSIGAQYFTRLLGSSCRVWKYVACMLMVLVLGIGQMWGTTGDLLDINFTDWYNDGGTTQASGTHYIYTASSGTYKRSNVAYFTNSAYSQSVPSATNYVCVTCSTSTYHVYAKNNKYLSSSDPETYSDSYTVSHNSNTTAPTTVVFTLSSPAIIELLVGASSIGNTSATYGYTAPTANASKVQRAYHFLKTYDYATGSYPLADEIKLNSKDAIAYVTDTTTVAGTVSYEFDAGKLYSASGTNNKKFYIYAIRVTTYSATPATYTLAWNLDGGSVDVAGTAAGSYAAGTTITAPTVSKTGHAFNGWDPAVPATMPAANSEYTATWTPSVYSVTLHTNDGTINSGNVSSYTFGVGATLPTDVLKASCDFAGWYASSTFEGERVYTIGTDATGDKEYWAKWQPAATKHSITYAGYGSADMSGYPTQYSEGVGIASFESLEDTEDEHFLGWNPTFISAEATTDQTITATWEDKKVVTFNSNGGSAVAAVKVVSGETVSAPTAPTRLNWTFQKWQKDGVDYDFATAVTEDITLDAVWSRNEISGEESSEVIVSETTNPSAPLTNPEYGYSQTYTEKGKYALTGGMYGGDTGKRYVKFTIPNGCTGVAYLKGTKSNTRKLVLIGEATKTAHDEATGDAKTQFNDASECEIYISLSSGTSTADGTSGTLSSGDYWVTASGGGLDINTLTVALTSSPLSVKLKVNGDVTQTINVTSGEKLGNLFLNGELPELVITGYTFNGWKNEEGDAAVSKTTEITKSMVIYADLSAATYDVTLSAGTNATSAGTATVQMGAGALTITSATTGSGALKGFYTTSDGDVKVAEANGTLVTGDVTGYVANGKWDKASDTELFAQYAPSYDVKFFPGYGENTQIGETQSILGGSYAVAPADPEREGFKFLGWSITTSKDDIKTVGSYGISAATDFTAIWQEKFKVAYYDGATKLGEEDVYDGESPAHSGDYEERMLADFDGWYNNADLAEGHKITSVAALEIDDNANIYGKWTKTYASDVDFVQLVTDEGKSYDYATFLSGKGYLLTQGTGHQNELDNTNAFDTGLKLKNSTGNKLQFRAPVGKLVKVVMGKVNGMTYSVNGATAKSLNGGTDKDHLGVTYMYNAGEQEITLTETATAYNMLKSITMSDAPVVIYDATTNGGTCATADATFTGTALTLPAATKDGSRFDGWFTTANDETETGTLVGLADATYTPASSTTLYARFTQTTSLATLTDIKVNGTTVTGFASDKYSYDIVLPYKTASIPTIAYTRGYEGDGESAGEAVTMSPNPITSATGDVTLHVVSENGTVEQDYVLHFTEAPKDMLRIIKIATTGGSNKTVTGYFAKAADCAVSLQSNSKFGTSSYMKMALDEEEFQAGDVLNVHITAVAGDGSIALYSTNNSDDALLYNSGVRGVVGDNKITLTDAIEGRSTLYLCRTSNNEWNPFVDYIEVYRPYPKPLLTGIKIDEAVAVVDENDATVYNVTIPAGSDLASLDVVPTFLSNDPSQTNGEVTSNEGVWIVGPNTYVVTDKDGDSKSYTINIARDVAVESLTVSGKTTVAAKSQITLTATVLPANVANKAVTWSSSDETKATVDANGVITGKAEGTVTITATSVADGSIYDTHVITVTKFVGTEYAYWFTNSADIPDDLANDDGTIFESAPSTNLSNLSASMTVEIDGVNREFTVTKRAGDVSFGTFHVPADFTANLYVLAVGSGDGRTVNLRETTTKTVYTSTPATFGNTATKLVYSNIPAGTYEFVKVNDQNSRVAMMVAELNSYPLTSIALEESFNLRLEQSRTPVLTLTPTKAAVVSQVWSEVSRTGASDATFSTTTGEISAGNEEGTITVKVKVTDAFGNEAESGNCVVNIVDIIEQKNVTGSMTWNWTSAGTANVAISSDDALALGNYISGDEWAYIKGTKNDFAYNTNNGGCYQGVGTLSFTTTVPGLVTITARRISEDASIKIGSVDVLSISSANVTSKAFFVPAGEVNIVADATNGMRILKIEFDADLTADKAEGSFYGGYTRNVTEGRMGTVCVDHNVPAGCIVGAEVYKLLYWKYGTSYENCQMVDFEQVDEMNAGEPYMIIPTGSTCALFYGATKVNAPLALTNGFTGTFDPITAASDALYGMYGIVNNMIQKLGHDCYSQANRAYIDLSQTPSKEAYDAQPHMTNHAPRKRVSLGHKITTEEEPIATGLDAINVENTDVQKVLINGEMFIIRDGHIYSATGMMVK